MDIDRREGCSSKEKDDKQGTSISSLFLIQKYILRSLLGRDIQNDKGWVERYREVRWRDTE